MPTLSRNGARRWIVTDPNPEFSSDLINSLGLHPVTARLLANRGIYTAAEALEFMNPTLETLPDPWLLPDFEIAIDRINQAIDLQQTIFVHGDYDVDGVTSAALFTRVLTRLGAKVAPFVPSRFREGYGVRTSTVERAYADGAGLLLTCDCGVSAHDACTRAKELGLDVVVTDHHQCPEELPCALAVVNPSRPDSQYPFRFLAGVGVAYKICQGLCQKRGVGLQALHNHFLDLVALGTVSDVAPLIGENRAYVYHGLRQVPKSKKEGLKALIRASGISDSEINSEDIGFKLGPRINAIGRLAEAAQALELFLTTDAAFAAGIAAEMSAYNSRRQVEQGRIFAEAMEIITTEGLADDYVLVVGNDNWQQGIVGIVAGKLAELFYRPAVVLNRQDGRWHGSARSIPGFDLGEAIRHLGDLVSGGGHAMAAGISFDDQNLGAVRSALNELAGQWLKPEDLEPRLHVEMELPAEYVTWQLADEIRKLAPFGDANPEPVFVTYAVPFEDIRTVGADGKHLRIKLPSADVPTTAVGFGMGDVFSSLSKDKMYNICYCLRTNNFNGNQGVDLMLQDQPVEVE